MTYQDHIARDPHICGGQPVIRGTRVPVRIILGHLAHGEAVESIIKEFPTLSEADVRAVNRFRGGLRGRGPSCPEPRSA